MQWLLWKLYRNWVASRKTRMHSFLKDQKSFGKPDAESLERNSKSSIHEVHATTREYPV